MFKIEDIPFHIKVHLSRLLFKGLVKSVIKNKKLPKNPDASCPIQNKGSTFGTGTNFGTLGLVRPEPLAISVCNTFIRGYVEINPLMTAYAPRSMRQGRLDTQLYFIS